MILLLLLYCVILTVDQIKYLRGVMVRLCSRVGIKFTFGGAIFYFNSFIRQLFRMQVVKTFFFHLSTITIVDKFKGYVFVPAMFLSICILNNQKSALVDVIYTNSWFILKFGLQLYSCPCTSMFCSTINTDSVCDSG